MVKVYVENDDIVHNSTEITEGSNLGMLESLTQIGKLECEADHKLSSI